jgi:O-antigen/teichoic acid export membrane protein
MTNAMFDNPEHPGTPAPLRTDTLADSVLILLGLTAVQRLVGFARAVLFCRWLDPEQLGQWDMAFSFLLLAAPLSVLAIPGAFGRYLEHYRQQGQLRTFLRRTMLGCGVLALAALGGVVAARRQFSMLVFGSEDQSELIALAALCLTTVIAYNFLIELFTALRNVRLVSVVQFVNSVAFAVLGVVLLLCWECSARSVLMAYGGSCLLAAAWAAWSLRRVWRCAPRVAVPIPHGALWAKMLPFAGWVLLANVLTNLFEVVDRYMIVHFSRVPAAEALDLIGNYHSSRVVPMLLVSIAAMLAAVIMPHLSHDWEAGRRAQVAARLKLFLKLFGFALFAAGVAVLLAAPLLFDIALRGKFPGGAAVLPWTLVYCTWFGLSLVLQNYLLCAERARLSSVALLAGLALNVPLNLALLPRLGLQGAVLATAAANGLSLALVCAFNHRLGFRLDDGARLVLVLPMLICLGPWVATFALAALSIDAIYGDRLLTRNEKRQIAEGLGRYAKHLPLFRRLTGGY